MRPRPAAITLVTLSVASLAVAIELSVAGHVSAIVQIIPFALSIPGLFLGWLAYRGDSQDSAYEELTVVADDLADMLLDHWETESRVRQAGDSEVMSVSWEPADESLVESWSFLLRAAPAAPDGARSGRGRARRPREMNGSGSSLVDLLKRIPTERLVVLGGPGSGKTVLLIRLLLGLLRDRKHGTEAPVPVIVQLASWDPSRHTLRSWLISRLILDYPALKNPWKSSTESCTLAEGLLKKHLLLIMLDGLDEIPEKIRVTAISKINDFLTTGTGIVLSCRTDEYSKALDSSGVPGRPMKLHGAAGILLRPLTDTSIRDYILGDAEKDSVAARRWDPVFRALALPTPPPVAIALRTPLMVALAREVYDRPRLNEPDEARAPDDPGELCDRVRFADPQAVESHLFREFVRTAYEPRDDDSKNQWEPGRAERWLRFLARHLQAKKKDYNILAWWEIRDAAPDWLVPTVVGIICGAASGLAAGFGAHVGFGIGVGLGAGAFVGIIVSTLVRRVTKYELKPSKGIAGALIAAIPGALAGAALAGKLGIGHVTGHFGGLAVALAVAIGVGSSTNFPGGLAGGLSGSLLAAALEGFGTGLPAGLMDGAGMGLAAAMAARYVGRRAPAYRITWSPLGAVCGLAIGTAVGLITWRTEGRQVGLLAGAVVAFLSALPCGLTYRIRRPTDKATVLSPGQSLRHDYQIFWMTAPPAGIAAAVAGVIAGGLVSIYAVKGHADFGHMISDGLGIGLAAGVIIGIGFGLHHAASVFFAVTRCWLACRGRLPWRLMRFLDDAHAERGILRQSGSFYQFRHLGLMHWLAASDTERPTAPRGATPSRQSTPDAGQSVYSKK